jgi:hypothetical protein
VRKGQKIKPRQTLFGKTMTLRDWAREYGQPESRVHARLAMGWSFLDALTQPRDPRGRKPEIL